MFPTPSRDVPVPQLLAKEVAQRFLTPPGSAQAFQLGPRSPPLCSFLGLKWGALLPLPL